MDLIDEFKDEFPTILRLSQSNQVMWFYNFEKDCKMYIVFLVSYQLLNLWLWDQYLKQENIPFTSEKHHFNSDSLEGVYVKQKVCGQGSEVGRWIKFKDNHCTIRLEI